MNIYFTHAKSLVDSWWLDSVGGGKLSSNFLESVLETLRANNNMVDDGLLDALQLGCSQVLSGKIGSELGDGQS